MRFSESSASRATLWITQDWQIVRASYCAARVFGKACSDDVVGLGLWEVIPHGQTAPLGHVLHDVMASRERRVVQVPSVIRPNKDVWARVSPTRDGGLRVAFRITARRRRVFQRFASSAAGPLLLGMKMLDVCTCLLQAA